MSSSHCFLLLLHCFTTGNQCGAFSYEKIAVGSLGSISFSSCHKWSHGKIILDGNFVFFPYFSFIFLWRNSLERRADKIELYGILQLLENTHTFSEVLFTQQKDRDNAQIELKYFNHSPPFPTIISSEEEVIYQNSVQYITFCWRSVVLSTNFIIKTVFMHSCHRCVTWIKWRLRPKF